jgi:DNA-binding IclR family transcriptional regulator
MASSRLRMLSILDLFDKASPVWAADAICTRLACSTSSGYRYIRELCAAGLLTRISGGSYVLGPRIVQLELLMREIDPVSQTGQPLIADLVRQTGCDVLLANMYGDHIVNVLHERGVEHLPLSYDRGRPHPLFRGAMSKAILAFLPRSRALRLYNAHAPLAAESGMGHSWREFWQALQQIKKKGYSESYGELDVGVIGIGAPVFNGDEVMGSVSIGCSRARLALLNKDTLIALLLATARRISKDVESIPHAEPAPAEPSPALT